MRTHFFLSNLMQRGILLLWSLWFTLVSLTDFTNFLQKINILPESFIFSSRNYDLIVKSLSIYSIDSSTLSLFFFCIVLVFASVTAIAFWIALFSSKSFKTTTVYIAFILSFVLSGAFLIWDEIFFQYEMGHGVMQRLEFQGVSFLILMILENKESSS